MSIRWKLFALLLALGALTSTLGLWTAWLTAHRAAREAAMARFASLPVAWRAALEPRLKQLEDDVMRLAADTKYSSCMERASSNPLDFAAPPGDLRAANLCLAQQALHTRWGSTFVLLNDRGLQIIRQQQEEADIGKDFSADRSVVQALRGHTAFDVNEAARELDVATPVKSPEGRLLGVALAGVDLDELLDTLGRELGVGVALARDAGPATPVEEQVDGRDLLIQSVALPDREGRPLLRVRLQRDLAETLGPLEQSIRRGAVLGGLGSLLLALVLGLAVAGRATRPLRALAEGTEAVAHGKYDTRVPVRGRDEIGRLSASFNTMAEGLGQRVFFESALRRYLAPAVVEDLLRDPTRMELGGQRREMTVLFFDVAGFTSLSESLAPDVLVNLCNGYLEQVVNALFAAGGTLDKFIGDAVMALFNAPLDQPDHALRSCRAAIEMQRVFKTHVAGSGSEAVRGLRARVGLHTGTAAFGNLGARSIMSLTAMGDAVNLASRLEGVNKIYGTSILASEATVLAAGPGLSLREIDKVRVLGRNEPVRIFELLGAEGLSATVTQAYAEGLKEYRAGKFSEAARVFNTAAAAGDRPAVAMALRSARLLAAPPPPDWDGSLSLDQK